MNGLMRCCGPPRPGRVWVLCSLLLLAPLNLTASNPLSAQNETIVSPVRITVFTYDPQGQLVLAPEPQRRELVAFHYGQDLPLNVLRPDPETSAEDYLATLDSGGAGEVRGDQSPPSPPHVYDVDRWTEDQGLPATKVWAICQTRDGWLWVGTAGGLARFDGVRFTPVELPGQAPPGTGSPPSIRCLFEDDDGRLWVGTRDGLFCWFRGRFLDLALGDALTGIQVNGLGRRREGGVWIATDEGVGYSEGTGFHPLSALPSQISLSLLETEAGRLWVGTEDGIRELDTHQGIETRRFLSRAQLAGIPNKVTGLLLDRQRRLWIGAERGLRRLDLSQEAEPVILGGSGENPLLRSTPYIRFAEDSAGAVWISLHSGIVADIRGLVRNDREDQLLPILIEKASGGLVCIASDREGVIWAGGQNGLFRLKQRPLSTVAIGFTGIGHDTRVVGLGADGALWLVNNYKWGRWSKSDLWLCHVRTGESAGNDHILSLPLVDPAQLGQDGLGHPSAESRFTRPFIINSPGGTDPSQARAAIRVPSAMTPARDGRLWLATTEGLCRIESPTQVEWFPTSFGSAIQVLHEDAQTNLWIGTAADGLFRWDGSQMHPFEDPVAGPSSIQALHADEDGSLWVGTLDGLHGIREGRWIPFGPGSGVPQKPIGSILEDDFGRLWMSYSDGILRVAKADLERWLNEPSLPAVVTELGLMDGLLALHNSRDPHPCAKGPDGRLWFGRRGGLVVVDPTEVWDVPAPQVFLEGVVARGEELLTDGWFHSDSDVTRKHLSGSGPREGSQNLLVHHPLPPGGSRRLVFQFTATSLYSPERVRFRYRLDGHDADWRDGGNRREAHYHDLPPGRYVFRVQARNHQGRWSERDAVVAFQAVPFFWETRGFQVACGVVVCGGLGGAMRWRLRRQHRRLEAKRRGEIERERNRIARDLHDHLGANLAMAALGPRRNDGPNDPIHKSLQELNDLIWMVHPENDTLESVAGFIVDHCTRCLSAAGLELSVDLPAMFPDVTVSGEVRREMAGLLKETLRNVVEHSGASRVLVRIGLQEGNLLLSVKDNGRGFAAVATGEARDRTSVTRGHGLRDLRERCEWLRGTCRVGPAPEGGTQVEFILPLHPLLDLKESVR